MKTTIKKIASMFLILVMALTVSTAIAEPLPITGDMDLLDSGKGKTVDEPLPITGDMDLFSASFTLVFINGAPALVPVVI